MSKKPKALQLAPRLKAVMAQEYPRFSDKEYARRHKLLAAAMQEVGADTLLVVTENRSGNATQWVTGWPGTVEAYTVFRPGEKMWMTGEGVNHYPLAAKMCSHMDAVGGQPQGPQKLPPE